MIMTFRCSSVRRSQPIRWRGSRALVTESSRYLLRYPLVTLTLGTGSKYRPTLVSTPSYMPPARLLPPDRAFLPVSTWIIRRETSPAQPSPSPGNSLSIVELQPLMPAYRTYHFNTRAACYLDRWAAPLALEHLIASTSAHNGMHKVFQALSLVTFRFQYLPTYLLSYLLGTQPPQLVQGGVGASRAS